MDRTADYTIKGFLYQINKTLVEILSADDDTTVNIEGVVEDIEVVGSTVMTGIQCKYHEAAVAFTHMLRDLCVEIANGEEAPRWKDSSFFKRFATDQPVAHAAN